MGVQRNLGRAPSKVKVFTYLLMQERILTRDVLQRKGIHCQLECVMCNLGIVETAVHLICHCRYAKWVWSVIASKWGMVIMQPLALVPEPTSVQDIWKAAWRNFKRRNNVSKKVWAVRFMAVCWNLWLQRNELIFRGKRLPEMILADRAWGGS